MAKNKLKIIKGRLMGNTAVFAPGEALGISFNPTEYEIGKINSYPEAAIPGLESPPIQFGRGGVRTLSFELLIDTYAYEGGMDIRSRYITGLESLMEVDGAFHAPPPCKVLWGSLEFIGVLECMRKKYILFKEDGTPVRARINLLFKEYAPIDIQLAKAPRNSPDKHKIHILQEGDSLWHLAYREYGDPRQWRFIAKSNGIDNPLDMTIGKKIVLAPLVHSNRNGL
jgi:hypothetical protein